MTSASHSLDNLDLESFSFRWDLGLDCEDEDESISDYGTVLHTGETSLSGPLTNTTGLSAVEEITEGGLTDSRTTSTGNRLSLIMPPSDNELGSFPSHDRKDLDVTKPGRNLLGRFREAMVGDRLVSRIPIPWSLLVPAPPVVRARANSSEKPLATLHPRPRNKLRKKTRPSIAITLAVEPASSFSLAQQQDEPSQPLPRSMEILQNATSSVSVSPVTGLPSARSFLSFQLPPVFSRARSRVYQKSAHRPANDMGVINATANQPDLNFSRFRIGKSGGRVSRDSSQQPVEYNDRTSSVGDNGIGDFPTPIRSAGSRDRGGRSGEGRPSRMSTSWEFGLGLGQDLGLKVSRLCHVRGG